MEDGIGRESARGLREGGEIDGERGAGANGTHDSLLNFTFNFTSTFLFHFSILIHHRYIVTPAGRTRTFYKLIEYE